MSSPTAPTLAPSITRPVQLRVRGDLTAHRQIYQGQVYWVIKEPVGLNYFRFPEESYYVMNLIDGHRSLEQIQHMYNERFSPKKITIEKLQTFVGSLHRAGLLQSPVTGQADSLLKRRAKTRRQKLFSKFGNILAVRFRGIDPERILTRLIPYTSWIFSRPVVIIVMIAALCALLSIFINWDLFLERLPTFNEFFDPMGWIALACVLAVTKILHEFGHGLTCKRFGGECHEMGFMLLVLTPCLYCNVSDSWTLANKWHRAAIGAAGIYVEVILATIATFLWWNTEPGFFNQLCLQVMTICSVSTLLFNGNPLLRFDGYYILSDVLEIPNLQQKSSQSLQHFLKKRVLGIKHTQTTMMPTRNKSMFIAYAFASIIYRWFILFVILMFLNKVFEPYGLQVIGQMIAVMAIGTLIGMPLYKFIKFLKNPSMRYQIRMRRALTVIGISVAVVAGILAIPLPYYVYCEFTVRGRESDIVFVQSPGEIVSVSAMPGQTVNEGDTILVLEDLELHRALAEVKGSMDEKQVQIGLLQFRSLRDDVNSQIQLATTITELKTLTEMYDQTAERIKQLTVRAPKSGTLLPAIDTDQRTASQNRANSVKPLEVFHEKNRNAYLPMGMAICSVGNPEQLEVILSIPEDRVAFVKPGQAVELKPYAFASTSLETQIAAVAPSAVRQPTQETDAPAAIGAVANAVMSQQNQYLAAAPIPDDNKLNLKVGSQGRARIRSGNRSLGSRISRWAADTFRFQ